MSDDDYLPPEAVSAASDVMTGKATPAEAAALERRWPPHVWRAAIRLVIARVNSQVADSGL